jgi:hypothetical protein
VAATGELCLALHVVGKAVLSPKTKILSRAVLAPDVAWGFHCAVGRGRGERDRDPISEHDFRREYSQGMAVEGVFKGGHCSFHIDGIVVVGAPVGSVSFMRTTIRQEVQKLGLHAQSVYDLRDPQIFNVLARYSLTKSLIFLLRNSPPHVFEEVLEGFDRDIVRMLLQLAYHSESLPPALLRPTSLSSDILYAPVRDGGFGVTCSSELGSFAYFAAQMAAIDRIRAGSEGGGGTHPLLAPVIQACLRQAPPPAPLLAPLPVPQAAVHTPFVNQLFSIASSIPPLFHEAQGKVSVVPLGVPRDWVGRGKVQAFVGSLLANKRMHRISHNVTPGQKATLLSAASDGGGAFKLVLPIDSITRIPPAEFAYLMRRNLLDSNPAGVPPYTRCACGAQDSGTSSHLEMCKKGGGAGVIGVHDAIVAETRSMLAAGGCSVDAGEPRGYFRMADGRTSAGGCDVAFKEHPTGRRIFADVSRTNECAPGTVAATRSDLRAGNAAEARAVTKCAKFAARCEAIDVGFLPLTLEIGGFVGRVFESLIRTTAQRVSNIPPPLAPFSAPSFVQYWRQRLVVVSQVGAARHALRGVRFLVPVGGRGAGVGGVGVGGPAPQGGETPD